MEKFLANENVPGEAVVAARQAGHDVAWIAETSPVVVDDLVLATALALGNLRNLAMCLKCQKKVEVDSIAHHETWL